MNASQTTYAIDANKTGHMTRIQNNAKKMTVKVTHTITPGNEETGCLTCFYSPPEYPILAKCPCFDYPEYIVNEIKASQ